MKGQVVVCRDVIGQPLIRVAWELKGSALFIHDHEQFKRRMSGENHLEPVGFPVEDVFRYDDDLMSQAKRDGVSPWSLLVPYNSEA